MLKGKKQLVLVFKCHCGFILTWSRSNCIGVRHEHADGVQWVMEPFLVEKSKKKVDLRY